MPRRIVALLRDPEGMVPRHPLPHLGRQRLAQLLLIPLGEGDPDPAFENGTGIVQDQRMTAAVSSQERARTVDFVRRIGAEQGVPSAAYDRMEGFVTGLSGGSVKDIVGCCAVPPRPLEDATEAS